MYYFYCHFCNEVIKYWKANPSQRELRRYHNDLLEDYDKPNPKKYRCRRREKVLIERRKALLANDTMDVKKKEAKLARIEHYMNITTLDDA